MSDVRVSRSCESVFSVGDVSWRCQSVVSVGGVCSQYYSVESVSAGHRGISFFVSLKSVTQTTDTTAALEWDGRAQG